MLSRIGLERPRGKTALKWMTTIPNQGLIQFGEFSGRLYLLPTTPQALIDVLSTRAYDYAKPEGLRRFIARVVGFGLLLTEGNVHKQQRRLLQGFFKPHVLRPLYPVLWGKAQELVVSLEHTLNKQVVKECESDGGVVEMSEWARNLTMDFIGLSTMGYDFKSFRENPDKVIDRFSELSERSVLQDTFLVLSMKIPEWITNPFRWGLDPSRWKANRALHSFCDRMVNERKRALAHSSTTDPSNLLDILIQQGSCSNDELVDHLLTILGAGHDTSASTLMWCCYELCQNRDIQAQLRSEVRAAIPSISDYSAVSWETVESLPLLDAIIYEVLRLYPAVPMLAREAVRDTRILNHHIPKRTRIAICPYAFNRLPEFWGKDADRFVPNRWIDIDEFGRKALNGLGGASTKYAHITFSHGHRSCIGRPVAFIQLRCALAAIFGRFQMELVNPDIPVQPPSFITMRALEGVPFRLTKVEGW
ncbi:cytochrome P450 [Aspergillus minisclerotigenes]|uniref:Cytochrome P450 n=1 Tax=Aspergillus minisclerotigenes TaxID=656917 RepID=A0A5N6J079_9EURO|nr:cytochrome P450 [Aspergillus minisclerotigenes]